MTEDRVPELFLFRWELDSMPEYSTSLPTMTTVGRMWKRAAAGAAAGRKDWYVGTYAEHEDPEQVRILWFRVVLRSGPAPAGYGPPDWHNSGQSTGPWSFPKHGRAAREA